MVVPIWRSACLRSGDTRVLPRVPPGTPGPVPCAQAVTDGRRPRSWSAGREDVYPVMRCPRSVISHQVCSGPDSPGCSAAEDVRRHRGVGGDGGGGPGADPENRAPHVPAGLRQAADGDPVMALPRFDAPDGSFSVSTRHPARPTPSRRRIPVSQRRIPAATAGSRSCSPSPPTVDRRRRSRGTAQADLSGCQDGLRDPPMRWWDTSPVTARSPTTGRRVRRRVTAGFRIVVMTAVKNDVALVAFATGPYHAFGPDFGPGRPRSQPRTRSGHGQSTSTASTGRAIRAGSGTTFSPNQFVEALVVDPEVVGQFVDHRDRDLHDLPSVSQISSRLSRKIVMVSGGAPP